MKNFEQTMSRSIIQQVYHYDAPHNTHTLCMRAGVRVEIKVPGGPHSKAMPADDATFGHPGCPINHPMAIKNGFMYDARMMTILAGGIIVVKRSLAVKAGILLCPGTAGMLRSTKRLRFKSTACDIMSTPPVCARAAFIYSTSFAFGFSPSPLEI